VIGGAQILSVSTLSVLDRLYITHVDADVKGTPFFPKKVEIGRLLP